MPDHTTRPDPRALNFEDGAELPPPEDTDEQCAYCGTVFALTDLFWISQQPSGADVNPFRVARCPACHAIHRQGTCGRCNTEGYHPTLDNTPFGESACRRCTTPDPFTNLLGFISSVVVTAQQSADALSRTQRHNTELTTRLRDLAHNLELLERERAEIGASFQIATRLHVARITDLETELAKTLHTQQRLDQRNEEVHVINQSVHEQMANLLRAINKHVAAIEPLTPDAAIGRVIQFPELSELPLDMAIDYSQHVSVTQRYHGDIHLGPTIFHTIHELVRFVFSDGFAAGIRWEGERRAR